jgi:hypothetical protein
MDTLHREDERWLPFPEKMRDGYTSLPFAEKFISHRNWAEEKKVF